MKLRFNKNVLAYATGVVQGVARPQNSLPILNNMRITAGEDGKVVFEASDMESCVRCTVDAEVLAPGAITVPAKKFHDIVMDLPDAQVDLDFSGSLAAILSERKKYDLTIQSAEDFPNWPDLSAATTLELEHATLKRMLNHVLFAVPQRDPRRVLLGVHFDVKDNELVCVATDGKKLGLSRCAVPVVQGVQPTQAIIPGRVLSELQRNLKDDGVLKLLIGERQTAFDMGDIVYLSNRIEGIFPNYEMVIPQEFTKELPLDRSALQREVHRASLISEEKNHSIIMHFESGRIVFSSRTSEVGSFEGDMEVSYDGEPFDIAFSHVFLMETLKVIDQDKIVMKIKQNNAPVVFVMPDMEESLFLVMPIKLTEIAEYQQED